MSGDPPPVDFNFGVDPARGQRAPSALLSNDDLEGGAQFVDAVERRGDLNGNTVSNFERATEPLEIDGTIRSPDPSDW